MSNSVPPLAARRSCEQTRDVRIEKGIGNSQKRKHSVETCVISLGQEAARRAHAQTEIGHGPPPPLKLKENEALVHMRAALHVQRKCGRFKELTWHQLEPSEAAGQTPHSAASPPAP